MNVEATFVKGKNKGSLASLRDPDGFTYVRNRCRGDQIFWVCSTHRHLGCRASAKTNGFILERLNGTHQYHHIPIVRKPRVDQPRIDPRRDEHHLWGTNGEGVPATFIPGTTGGVVLVDPNEFHYTRDKTAPSGKQYWKCRRYGQHVLGQHKCKATALTEGKTLLRTTEACS